MRILNIGSAIMDKEKKKYILDDIIGQGVLDMYIKLTERMMEKYLLLKQHYRHFMIKALKWLLKMRFRQH